MNPTKVIPVVVQLTNKGVSMENAKRMKIHSKKVLKSTDLNQTKIHRKLNNAMFHF